MEKRKYYPRIKFGARILRRVIGACMSTAGQQTRLTTFNVAIGNEQWQFDDLDEYLIQYARSDVDKAYCGLLWDDQSTLKEFRLQKLSSGSEVTVRADTRNSIEAVFSMFEEAEPDDQIRTEDTAAEPTIFIGHGRRKEWEALKSHLQDKHKLNVVAYETGARAGHTIRDILDDLAEASSFALLVLTGEDETEVGTQARQNVIHECGLFQGRLGFERAIMLVEKGIVLGSNFDGIQQLRFRKGRISEVYGDVLATLKREFGPL